MLSVYSPLQIETSSSFPFHTEMRSNLSSHSNNSNNNNSNNNNSNNQQHSSQNRDQQQKQPDQSSLRPPSHTVDWKPSSHPSLNSASLNNKPSTAATESLPTFVASQDSEDSESHHKRSTTQQPIVKLEDMIHSQTHAVSQSVYNAPFYSGDYNSMKTITPHLSSSHYNSMSPYSRQTIHDRRQSMMASHGRAPNTPPSSGDSRPRPDYPTQEAHPSLADDIPAGLDASQPTSSWDPAQSQAQPHVPDSHARGLESYSAVQMNLPPLSEALHSLSASSPSMAVSPPMPTHQAALSSMSNVMASPPQFYATNAYLEMQAPVNIYTAQDQFDSNPSRTQDRHSSQTHGVNGMVSQDPNANSSYNRRMTYPFVPSLETSGANLVMSNVMSTEQAGSSPLSNNGAFPQGGLVGASPVMDYVDSLALQQHQVHPQAASHHHTHTQPTQPQQALHSTTWSQNGSSMQSIDGGANSSKVYSFVPLSGVNSRKRPRRRFEEIERLYVCSWGDCEKAYGTLNHLNAHVNMQKHGPKRLPAEFKELRKAWRKHKRAEEDAAKQAAAFHQQQNHTQQQQAAAAAAAQLHPSALCDPVLAHMHQGHLPLAMHTMTHHQPHQLPHPHAHPNQHHAHPHHSQSHHHPMGF